MAQTTPNCPATITVDGRTVLCQGETTTLRASTGAGLTYQWILNGIDIAGATGETLQVSAAGNYQVRVSGGSCQTTTSAETAITVNPRPNTPGFVVDPTTAACSGTPLNFSVNSPQTDVVYTWAFGDGSIARGATVSHTYDVRGTGIETYTVEVFGTSAASGCESEVVTRQVQVRKLPEISFTEKNNFVTCIADTVPDEDIEVFAEITNTTQEPYLSDIRSYFVDWGNGTEVQYRPSDFPIKNPAAFDSIGTYPIRIRAIAGNSCEEVFTQDYVVSKEPKANFSLDKKRAEENQQPPCVPVIVTPTDSSTGGGLSYEWSVQPDQGFVLDSGSLTSPKPIFRFTESGVYTIQLIVTNGCGTDTTSQGIVVGWPQVQPPPGGVFCGPTTIELGGTGAGGGGIPGGGSGGGMFIDKNLGENITVTITIRGPKSATRTFNSDTFTYPYDFDVPGRYTIAVEAVNECGSSNQIYQGQPPPPTEVVILQQPAVPSIQNPGAVCEGDTVRLAPTGPGPVYAWFDSNDPQATPIFVGPAFTTPSLPGGVNTFYVAARDTAQGVECTGPRKEITIQVNPRVANNTIQINGGDVASVCKGATPVQLTGSQPTGGAGSGYTYTWQISTTGANTGFATAPGVSNTINYKPTAPVNATTWFRRLVFSASCSADTSNVVEVTAVDPVLASANTIGPAQELCVGDTPEPLIGSRPSGGAGGPYTFLWEVSTAGSDRGFVAAPGTNTGENYDIPAGALTRRETWFRRVVSAGGCASPSEAIKITVNPALAGNTIGSNQTICTGTAPAALTGAAPTGGSGTYTYLWLSSTLGPDAGFAAAPGTNNGQGYTPGNLTQDTWFRRVISSGACTPDTSTAVQITVNEGVLNNTITAEQPSVCAEQTTVQITGSTPTGGNGTYRYLWESSISGPDAGFSPAPGANTGINYTTPTLTRETWFRRVVTSDNCSKASEAVSVKVTPLPANPQLTVANATACPGGSATLAIANANGETYEWYTTQTGGTPIFVGPSFTTPALTRNTTYYVQAVNSNQCISAARTTVTVTIVTPVADAGNDVTIIQGRTVELRASGGVTYKWEPATGLSNANVANPVARPDVTTTYTVTVTTAEGCTDTDEVTVTVIPAIVVPNAFSPNGDQVNEVWEIGKIENYPDVRVEVYNRWGNLIFSSTGYGTPWDGTYNGEALPVATYYYMIYLSPSEKPIAGDVTIIR
ncbi:gliding motility-associated C-terminal domain-containing protein [Pontibacter ruber]|uniref:Gliding motility-associated C-terminal domain-containing protein n=1 Tax=Pontibacter ruber TaxID=1343895 RepID=A0ABW5D0N7_9BACT|nr:gliding motility-associated C-terminal domain-containing protein [Pontibacter ruber]